MKDKTKEIIEKPEKSIKEKIIEAIQNQDVVSLEKELKGANALLTNDVSSSHFSSNLQDELKETLQNFLKNAKAGDASAELYLGDGGYSRIELGVNEENILVAPTENSTEKVKAKWEELHN